MTKSKKRRGAAGVHFGSGGGMGGNGGRGGGPIMTTPRMATASAIASRVTTILLDISPLMQRDPLAG